MAAVRIMNNTTVIPAWSQARSDIDEEIAQLWRGAAGHLGWLRSRDAQVRALPGDRIAAAVRITARQDERVREELPAEVERLNAPIDRDNVIVPVEGLRLALVRAAGLLAAGS